MSLEIHPCRLVLVPNTFRQTFLQFGDASWGSIKLGKDLGIFASDAILNDMTLLGVGAGSAGAAAAGAPGATAGAVTAGFLSSAAYAGATRAPVVLVTASVMTPAAITRFIQLNMFNPY